MWHYVTITWFSVQNLEAQVNLHFLRSAPKDPSGRSLLTRQVHRLRECLDQYVASTRGGSASSHNIRWYGETPSVSVHSSTVCISRFWSTCILFWLTMFVNSLRVLIFRGKGRLITFSWTCTNPRQSSILWQLVVNFGFERSVTFESPLHCVACILYSMMVIIS